MRREGHRRDGAAHAVQWQCRRRCCAPTTAVDGGGVRKLRDAVSNYLAAVFGARRGICSVGCSRHIDDDVGNAARYFSDWRSAMIDALVIKVRFISMLYSSFDFRCVEWRAERVLFVMALRSADWGQCQCVTFVPYVCLCFCYAQIRRGAALRKCAEKS